jgi:hypothetical protein
MRNPTRTLIVALALALSVLLALPITALPQQQTTQQSVGALERGYRTGYSDGYQAGYSDSTQNAARDYKNKDEYQRADRAYSASYGTLEDYRDGYQQGFEKGYDTGYERRVFDSTIPANISRRGTDDSQNNNGSNSSVSVTASSSPSSTSGNSSNDNNNSSSSSSSSNAPITTGNGNYIPRDTVLRIELLTNLSTEASQRGDRFQARVIEPPEFQGAMIEGHISHIKRPGKVKGNAELQLTFDQISLNGNWTSFKAQVIEVIDNGMSQGVGKVDSEGGVEGKSRTKDDITKVGASAGIGAILGGIFGGGSGAAIGAAIGGGVATGGVLTSRGKDVRLEHGQNLRIRTSTDTRLQ